MQNCRWHTTGLSYRLPDSHQGVTLLLRTDSDFRFISIVARRLKITENEMKYKIYNEESKKKASQQISWIANLLILNFSKTEFVLSWLNHSNPTATPCQEYPISSQLWLCIFDEYFLSPVINSRNCLNPAILIFVNCAIFVSTSLSARQEPAIAIVHSKRDYCNYSYYRLQFSELSNKLPSSDLELSCLQCFKGLNSHTIPILKSSHWLIITECIEDRLVSLIYEVLTILTPSVYSVYPVYHLSLRPACSSFTVRLLIAHSDMRHLVFGMNFLPYASN